MNFGRGWRGRASPPRFERPSWASPGTSSAQGYLIKTVNIIIAPAINDRPVPARTVNRPD
ncbi:MAG: hypothetical protein JWQ02_452 [Capsulimonas sp.]|nr:hypothetical protein [Capsulimonas sp.]